MNIFLLIAFSDALYDQAQEELNAFDDQLMALADQAWDLNIALILAGYYNAQTQLGQR